MTKSKSGIDLVVDIGGTNTRCGLARDGVLDVSTNARFLNAGRDGLAGVLTEYLSAHKAHDIDGICVALAGPIKNGIGTLTNLSWIIRPQDLIDQTHAKEAHIINDLQAQGYGLAGLKPEALAPVIDARTAPNGSTKLVLNVGTGFNCASVITLHNGVHVAAAESGHIGLPVRGAQDLDLSNHVKSAHGFAAVEDVLSGRGLERVYTWRSGGIEKSAADLMNDAEKGDAIALKTVESFIRILGAVAGDLTLIHLPYGGVYFVGGVARAMKPYFERMGFGENFRDKGRFATFMDDFSVQIVEDDNAAMIGCAQFLKNSR